VRDDVSRKAGVPDSQSLDPPKFQIFAARDGYLSCMGDELLWDQWAVKVSICTADTAESETRPNTIGATGGAMPVGTGL
jgi:hypothetical protein